MNKRMPKNWLAFLLSLALMLSLLPSMAFAEGTRAKEPDAACVQLGDSYVISTHADDGAAEAAAAPVDVQAMIDALPDTVDENNAESVKDQLRAIDSAMLALSDEEIEKLNPDKYIAAMQELGADYGIQTLADPTETGNADVAKVGNTTYSSLADAVNAAANGGTVTLQSNVQLTERVVVENNSTVTIDLNGYSITRGDGNETSYLLGVVSGSKLIVKDSAGNGKIESANFKSSEDQKVYAGFGILTNGAVEIQSGTISGYYGLYVSSVSADASASAILSGGNITGTSTGVVISGNAAPLSESETLEQKSAYSAVVNVSGNASISGQQWGITLWGKGAELNVSSGEITGKYFAISGNGTYSSSANYSGTVIRVSGGTVKATDEVGTGIYHPQDGLMEITGGTITGATGIEIRAGQVNVSGEAVITGTGSPLDVEGSGNGTTTLGAGIAVAQHTTKLPIALTVSGGTITGYTALNEANTQNNPAEDIQKVSINITGGSFTATNPAEGAQAVSSQDCENFISGGAFSSEVPAAYAAEGYEATGAVLINGYYTVCNHSQAVAVAAKAATCVDDGNIAYWYCPVCGKYFSGEDYATEITLADTVIPATGEHTSDGGVVTTEATTGHDGVRTYSCTVCGKVLKTETIPQISEHPEIAAAIADGTWGKAEATPAPTAKPAEAAAKPTTTTIPQTGDASNPALPAVVMIAALLGLCGTALARRRGSR